MVLFYPPPALLPPHYAQSEIISVHLKLWKSGTMDFWGYVYELNNALIGILMVKKQGLINIATSFLNGMFKTDISWNNGKCIIIYK